MQSHRLSLETAKPPTPSCAHNACRASRSASSKPLSHFLQGSYSSESSTERPVLHEMKREDMPRKSYGGEHLVGGVPVYVSGSTLYTIHGRSVAH